MSRSEPSAAVPVAENAHAATHDVAQTLRIIEAPAPAAPLPMIPAEQARTARALALAAEIERAIQGGKESVVLGPDAIQALIASLCKVYSAHVENGERYDVFVPNTVTPTDVMVTASGLLKAANLATFELGMWQSWTGR